LDVEKLNGDLKKLLACEVAEMPKYDFYTGMRKQETVRLCIDDDILIIEGIHGLNDALTRDIPADQKFKIFVSPLTTLNIDEHNVVFPDDLHESMLHSRWMDTWNRIGVFLKRFVWDKQPALTSP
jgi:uridine kinase